MLKTKKQGGGDEMFFVSAAKAQLKCYDCTVHTCTVQSDSDTKNGHVIPVRNTAPKKIYFLFLLNFLKNLSLLISK
jgi:hypothetical protein